MIIKWGSYSHETSGADLSVTRTPVTSETGDRVGYRETWTIKGMITGTSISDLTTKINALETAYATNAQDLKLVLDDGSTDTAHQMLTASTIGGTKVVAGPTFAESEGEYVTWRKYEIQVEGYFETASPALLAYSESVTIEEGQPEKAFIKTLTGFPQEQITAQKTTHTASQSGTAIGRADFPTPPSPIWPAKISGKLRVTRTGPKRIGPIGSPNLTEYGISWDYPFESATPLSGSPHVG